MFFFKLLFSNYVNVMGLISYNDESAYRMELQNLVNCCSENVLVAYVEVVVDVD